MKWLTRTAYVTALGVLCGLVSAHAGEGIVQGDLTISSNLTVHGDVNIGFGNTIETNIFYFPGAFVHGWNCKAGMRAYAGGQFAEALGVSSHAEGAYASALGNISHAQGWMTIAAGENSHAQGYYALASGEGSFAVGANCEALGEYSTALGDTAVAQHDNSFVWSSSGGTEAQRTSTTNDEFTVYAASGIRLLGGPTVVEPGGGLSMGSYTNRP